jgi:hypothetical protein
MEDIVGNKNDSDDVKGADWDPSIFTPEPLLSPLISCLRCGPIAKAPYFKINTKPTRCQINSSYGSMWGIGMGKLSLSVLLRENLKIECGTNNPMAFWT